MRSALADKTPRQHREFWATEHNRLISEDPDFPKTVDAHEPCFDGECMAELDDDQRALANHLLTFLRLICVSHAGANKCSLPCLGFTAGPHTLYGMVGAFSKSHPFKCEFLSLELRGPPTALGQFELAIAREPEPRLGARWPEIASEKAFVLHLVEVSLGPWQIFLLDSAVDQIHTVMVTGMTLMDLDELRELEAQRLERLHALRMFKKVQAARGGGVARAKSVHRAGQSCKGRADTDSSTDDAGAGPHPPAAPPEPDDEALPLPPPPHAPGVAKRARQPRGIPWGNSGWMLAEIKSDGRLIGCGATCKMHHTPGQDSMCKKSVSIGNSGLTRADLMLRLKRWLIAGLDDADWDTEDPRAEHIGMGGTYMKDFADGLSEAECDRIAGAA